MLVRVEACGIDRDETHLRVAEGGPGAGGEVLQPGAHGQDHVRLGRQRVGRGRADHAQRAGVHRVVVRQHRAPGDGLDDRQVVPLGEARQFLGRQGVVHPAAGDQNRLFRLAQHFHCGDQLQRVGPGSGNAVKGRLEKALGIIEGLGLNVLRQGDEGRPAVGRVQHGRDRLGQ